MNFINFINNFVKKTKKLFDLYIEFFFWFFIKISLDVVSFFLVNPVGLSTYVVISCAGLYSKNDDLFFQFLKLFFSYILVEAFFLSYLTKISKIREICTARYKIDFLEKLNSLNSALWNISFLVTFIILIDFLTDLFCIFLKSREVSTLISNQKILMEKVPINPAEQDVLTEKTLNTVTTIYDERCKGVFTKIFSTLFKK